MRKINEERKSAKLVFHHVAKKKDVYVTASEHRCCNDYSRCFNHTFWDTLTLRSYIVGAPTM
jgi:hypothetical protein